MMKCLFCLLAVVTVFVPVSVSGQSVFDETKLIPSSAMAAVFAQPQAILAEPSMELVPHEILTELGNRELGFDPCKIVKAMFLVDSVTDLRSPPGFALVLAFDSDQSIGEKITQQMEKGELKGKTIYRSGEMQPAIYQPNGRTIVFGTEPFIRKMISAKGASSELISLIKSKGADTHLSAFVTIEPVRGIINENLPPKQQIPFPLQRLRSLPDLIEAFVLKIDVSEKQSGRLEVIAIDESSADEIDKIIRQGVTMGRNIAMEYIAQEMESEEQGLKDAVQSYGERVGDYLEEHYLPKREGRSLVFEDQGSGGLAGIASMGTMVGMLLPAVQQVREAARRTQSQNNLRQFALASLNYEFTSKSLPNNITDEQGKPLLSWRVKILPFMDENRLYEQFHLDEPWDSPHNIKLVDQMPAIYASPNVPDSNRTVYLAFEGKETLFPGQKISLADITDGSSNTILFVEANADEAVEWSRPKDIPFVPQQRVTAVGDLRPGGFVAVFCDGSTHFISSSIDEGVLSRLIQRADGQPTGFEW